MAAILKTKMVSATTSTLCFVDLTIIFLGHNREGIPAQTIYLSCSVWEINIDKLTFCVAAILDYKMATTKIVNQSIIFPTARNVGVSTEIEFL